MSDRDDGQSRKLEQLRRELAELRACVAEQCRQAVQEREEARAVHAVTRRLTAQVAWLVPLNELRRVATSLYDAPILAALLPVRKSVARSRSASGSGSSCGTAGSGGSRQ
jgi:hypothetical protein